MAAYLLLPSRNNAFPQLFIVASNPLPTPGCRRAEKHRRKLDTGPLSAVRWSIVKALPINERLCRLSSMIWAIFPIDVLFVVHQFVDVLGGFVEVRTNVLTGG